MNSLYMQARSVGRSSHEWLHQDWDLTALIDTFSFVVFEHVNNTRILHLHKKKAEMTKTEFLHVEMQLMQYVLTSTIDFMCLLINSSSRT